MSAREMSSQTLTVTLHVITGFVPVIPIGKVKRFKQSGWPAQGRP